MFKKQKGQGALEYLLLIGGAVLIAVIVIALLVGMGGQSRKTAQDQGESAKDALDVPQPSYISYLVAKEDDCNADPSKLSKIKLSWNPIGTGGTHKLYFRNSLNQNLDYDVNEHQWTKNDPYILDPMNVTEEIDVNISSGFQGNNKTKCGDSYYAYIETTKNNQSVTSYHQIFSWSD